MTTQNAESAKTTLWLNQIWMRREELRLLLENYLFNKICWSEFSLDYSQLIREINNSTRSSLADWEKEIKSVKLNPKVAILANYIQELLFMDEIYSELLSEEEERGTFDVTLTYRNLVYGLYKSLLIASEEENRLLKEVIVLDQHRILQETVLLFSIVSLLTYALLKPGFIDFIWIP